MTRIFLGSLVLVAGLTLAVYAGSTSSPEVGVALTSNEMAFTVGATPPCTLSAYVSAPVCKSGLTSGSCVQAWWCCDSTSTTAAYPCAQEGTWTPVNYNPGQFYTISVDCADRNGTSCTCYLSGCFTNQVVIGTCGTKIAGGPC